MTIVVHKSKKIIANIYCTMERSQIFGIKCDNEGRNSKTDRFHRDLNSDRRIQSPEC